LNIISHRGFWLNLADRNRPAAFHRSFDAGFGTETDLRDVMGRLVISHDPPDGDEIGLSTLLDILARRPLPLALNIKADGLAQALQGQMRMRGLNDWFTFDMSVPEMVVQLRLGLPVYTRASDYERKPALYDQAVGIWLDGFVSDWAKPSDIAGFLSDGKRVAIVSPELHSRPHQPVWAMLRDPAIRDHPRLMLCTDLPEDARQVFGTTARTGE